MARVSVSVMAHPYRADLIPDLLGRLDRPAQVVWDEKDDRWDTGRRALLSASREATHHLVIQDDAIPCRDLVAGLERAIDYVPPESPLCLYLGKTLQANVYRAAAKGRPCWLTMPQVHWGVGIVVPTEALDSLVAFADKLDHVYNYDIRISRWAQNQNLTVYYPWPSLVEHRGVPSLVAGRSARRHAARFIGEHASALQVKWSKQASPVVYQPRERARRAKRPMNRVQAAARSGYTADSDSQRKIRQKGGDRYLIRTVDGAQRFQLPILFRNGQTPNLEVSALGIKFVDGWFTATKNIQVRYLLSTKARRSGVKMILNGKKGEQ